MRTSAAAATDKNGRDLNEDAFALQPEHGVFVVADGMGGIASGDWASRGVVDTFVTYLTNNSFLPVDQRMQNAAAAAKAALEADIVVDRHREGMGAVLAALVVDGGRLYIGHVGDARCYRLRGQSLNCLTEDHSLTNENRRAATPMSAVQEHRWRHIVTRAIGQTSPSTLDISTHDSIVGDLFLLCTDGLHINVDDATIAGTMIKLRGDHSAAALQTLCDTLVQQACGHTGDIPWSNDNVTCVCVAVVA